MQTEYKYSQKDQALIDQAQKMITDHSEMLIKAILKSSPNGEWDYNCERLYRRDAGRDLLIKHLTDIHSRMMPEITIKL